MVLLVIAGLLPVHPQLEVDREPLGELVLEMWHGAEALELSVHHDAEPVTQCLALLHAVGGEHHGLPVSLDPLDDGPQVPSCHGVHPSAGLVQEDDWGLPDQGHGNVELPLVAAAVAAGGPVDVDLDPKEVGPPVHLSRHTVRRNSTHLKRKTEDLKKITIP